MLGRKSKHDMRQLMAGRESLTFLAIFGVDADVMFAVALEAPAGFVRLKVVARTQNRADVLNITSIGTGIMVGFTLLISSRAFSRAWVRLSGSW